MSCPNCGYCEKCGRSDNPWGVQPWPKPQPYHFDGSWICVCGQRVYSMQYHQCPVNPGPTRTTGTIQINDLVDRTTTGYNRTQ